MSVPVLPLPEKSVTCVPVPGLKCPPREWRLRSRILQGDITILDADDGTDIGVAAAGMG